MTTGRDVPKTGEPVLLSSGITVYARKVSPFTRAAAEKAFPRPLPPMIEQDYGDGKTRLEPNEDDPAYAVTLREWQRKLTDLGTDLMIRLGVQVDIDPAALAEVRGHFEALGLPIDKDDHLAYVKHIAVTSEDDLTLLGNVITAKSQPTEEAVQDHLETFPDPVQGEAVPALEAENSGSQL